MPNLSKIMSYYDKSLRHKQNCPVCGKGLFFPQDVEGIHY